MTFRITLTLAALLAPIAAQAAQDAPARTAPMPATLAEVEAKAAEMHARMDLDHDGYVTPAEMQTVAQARIKAASGGEAPAKPLPALPRAIFDRADTDHDGRLSLAEAKAGADRTFAEMDTDHDGIVTPAERLRYFRRFIMAHRTGDTLPVPD